MKKLLIVASVICLTACDNDIMKSCTYKHVCPDNTYLKQSEVSYSATMYHCCKEEDKKNMVIDINECVKNSTNNSSNTKNQDYHEIPKTCTRSIMQVYCSTPNYKCYTEKELKEEKENGKIII